MMFKMYKLKNDLFISISTQVAMAVTIVITCRWPIFHLIHGLLNFRICLRRSFIVQREHLTCLTKNSLQKYGKKERIKYEYDQSPA